MQQTARRDPAILMISTDRNLLEPESAVASRHRDYGRVAQEIHIILFSLRGKHGAGRLDLSPNVTVYPTSSKSRWRYIFDAYRLGKDIIRDHRVTVISAQNPFETGIVAWLLSRKGIPFDLQLHTDPFSPFFKKGHGVMNRLRVFMARFLLPKARRVRVVSERIRRHLVALIPDPPPITVLPIFVDVSHIESAELSYDLHKLYPRFKTIIMTLSRLEPEKNIGLAITAFARLHDRFPGVGLVIIGKGSERSRLEQAAKEQGVASQVVFHGWVDDTASAFKTTDIFLLTSDFEGFALTLVEAAAAGLPIVTTDVGLVGDILKDEKGALVCPPCDPGCMAMKLEHLLLNVPLGRQLALNARRSVRDSLIRTNEEYIEAYRRLWSD